MKITVESVEYQTNTNSKTKKSKKSKKQKSTKPKKGKWGKSSNNKLSSNIKTSKTESLSNTPKNKKSRPEKQSKRAIVGVPTNKRDKLVDMGFMRRHNFLSATTPMLTKIFGMSRIDGKSNKYEMDKDPHHVSAILKLVLTTMQTNELSYDWSLILWNVTQQDEILPPNSSVTFTRIFERKDNELTKKKISRRRKLAILSSGSQDNIKRQSIATQHDLSLLDAIDSGDSVMAFGAEAIITSPTEQDLEVAVEAVKNYFKSNDETRGLTYELDINKQTKPFITYGANDSNGNKGVYTDSTSFDAAQSALFVDSGGDRTLGSEYLGVSVGKLIRSHAAYNFQNNKTLFVGNDTSGKTVTLGRVINEPSQIYLSKVASRAYLLTGHKVTHFVADDAKSVEHLMNMPIADFRKRVADVSKGLLNILEAIDDGSLDDHPERILSRFPTHINNIITLLSQFRSVNTESVTDDFANMARDILIDFFVSNKYWAYDARYNLDDIRFVGVQHAQFKNLSYFGQYVEQRKRVNKDSSISTALAELDTIINRNILPTIPALDTKTDDLIDEMVKSQYRVVDLTGMGVGSGKIANPSMNVMMISYLNLLLPTMSNGDVIMIHGISHMSTIAHTIKNIIDGSGLNLDVVYTEKNQNAAIQMMSATSEVIEEEDEVTHRMKKITRAMQLDFVMVDLYDNRSDKLVEPFGMDKNWVSILSKNESSFFIKTDKGLDYIYLDNIL